METMLKASEVAEMLRVKPQTLRKWRWRGVGPRFVKIGKTAQSRVLYPESAVTEWMGGK
jgi:predicted site-specific integrase-resolvase